MFKRRPSIGLMTGISTPEINDFILATFGLVKRHLRVYIYSNRLQCSNNTILNNTAYEIKQLKHLFFASAELFLCKAQGVRLDNVNSKKGLRRLDNVKSWTREKFVTALEDTYPASASMGVHHGLWRLAYWAVRLTANPEVGLKSAPDQEDNSEICESFTRAV